MNPHCASCPDQKETNEHVFFRCVAANPVMDYIRKIIQVLLRNQDFRLLKIALNKFPHGTSRDIKKMVTGLLQIAMHVIWNNRNQRKFKKIETHINESQNTISKHFKDAILTKYKKLIPHKRGKFYRKYCHTPEVCDLLENDVLHIDLEW